MPASQQRDPALIAQQPLPTKSFLEPTAIEWLLVCFAHDKQLFAEARELIAVHHFKPHETPLRLLYEAMCISQDSYQSITYESVASIINDMIQQNQTIVLTPEQLHIIFRRDPEGLIYQVCHPEGLTDAIANQNFSRDLLRRLAHERTVIEPLRRVMNPGFNMGVPSNIDDFLDVIRLQQARLSTLSSVPEFNMTPMIGEPLVESNKFVATGIPFVDGPLGGMRVGDCNGIIGPTGGGKTTLAIHMAVSIAKQSWADSIKHGTKPGLSIFVTAEEAAIKLRPRIWSAFFKIPRSKLDTMTDWSKLTTPGNLDPYERQFQAGQDHMLSEIERYTLWAPQLHSCLRVLDLSGSDQFPTAGSGYIPEIVSYLSRYNQPITSVFIDYAGIFCERYMAAKGLDERNYRYLLKTFGDTCRMQISERFRCTTWVLHQLKGSMGKSNPSKLMHHTDAGESADFANNMMVCGCLGVADQRTGCRRLHWSKCRYMPNEKIVPPTLKINDQFAIMDDVSAAFTISDSGQFMTQDEMNQVHTTADLERHRPTMGPQGHRDTSQPITTNPSQMVES